MSCPPCTSSEIHRNSSQAGSGAGLHLPASSSDSCRLTESEATLQKRLIWSQQQVSSAAAPGLFDVTVQNDSPESAYDGLQQAVATLSPAVRHKLQGLPADVLDYADLIPGTSVEQPILKPVLIAGERGACLPAHVTLDRAHHEPLLQHANIKSVCMFGAYGQRLLECFYACCTHSFTSELRPFRQVCLIALSVTMCKLHRGLALLVCLWAIAAGCYATERRYKALWPSNIVEGRSSSADIHAM